MKSTWWCTSLALNATLVTPVWKCQEGSKNLQRIPTPWGLQGGQYKAFWAIFEILQRKDSETYPDFGHKY